MHVRQIIPRMKIANQSPEIRMVENDQTFPAGMWRKRVQGDIILWERATATDWSTDEDWMAFDKANETIRFIKAIATQDAGELTIATGAITATATKHTVDTEGNAATDDLDTINGAGYTGQLLILGTANSARDVTLTDYNDSSGNIFLGGAGNTCILNSTLDRVLLQWDGTYWCLLIGPVSDVATQSTTLVVAASNSLNPGRADYVCDGTADDVEINAALAALPTQGGKIILLEGTFTIVDPIDIPDDDIVLEGQGRSTFIDGDGLATGEHAIEITGRTNVTIKNLALQTQDGGAKTCHGIFIQDGSNDFNIIGVVVVDCDSDAIHIEGTNIVGGLIADCIIADADDHGIFCDMDAANTMSKIIIRNNDITGCGSDGIYTGATGAACSYWVIEGNLIVSSTQNGIELSEILHSNIIGNVIHTSTLSGIAIATGCHHLNIEGNHCLNNVRHGITVVSATEINITGNTCSGNDSANANTYDGISLSACNYTTVVGNHCDDNDRHGIYVLRSSYCVISGNNCHENTQGDGINVTGDGTANSDYNSIVGNNCGNNGDDGIAIEGTTDALSNVVVGNSLLGNSGTALVNNGNNTQIGHNVTA